MPSRPIFVGAAISASLTSAVAGLFAYPVIAGLRDLLFVALSFAPAVRTISVLGVAFIVFLAKARVRAIYGFSEMYVGVYIATQKLGGHPLNSSLLVTDREVGLAVLCGGVYLIVSGMENVRQGAATDSLLEAIR
jgi:hypothetical protein